jgi:hypothetical protein
MRLGKGTDVPLYPGVLVVAPALAFITVRLATSLKTGGPTGISAGGQTLEEKENEHEPHRQDGGGGSQY